MQIIRQLHGGACVVGFNSFSDDRGSFAVPYEATSAVELGLPERFVQDNHSISAKPGTIRGLHLQLRPFEQGKLVRVLRGAVHDVVVDLRPSSPDIGHYESVELRGGDNTALWIPAGFGHGFCTLEPDTEVFYKVDAPYAPQSELCVAWDDPNLAIDWPVESGSAILSDKDRRGLPFDQAMNVIAGGAT